MRFSLALATLALSTLAFAQDYTFQVGYAANLNIGDSVVNLSNDGFNGGVFGAGTTGNICVNAYVFDPQEEEIGCCACLVTPNGLNSLSALTDLISNPLTPAIPNSITIALLASRPAQAPTTGTFTVCNPATAGTTAATSTEIGMLVWGTTLEPASTPGTYVPIHVSYKSSGAIANTAGSTAPAPGTELAALTSTCSFIQADGSGFGICNSCQTGALAGTKK